MRRVLQRLHQEQRGGVLIFVVVFVSVAFAVAAFVVDAANLFEHKRHLQVQADAGALAAAQEFIHCFTDPDAALAAIEEQALSYSGAVHNPQIGPPDAQERVQPRINATGYDTDDYSDGEPCDTGFIDVKLTEKDTPPFFAVSGSHDVRAHARVQIFKLKRSNKMLPIAVPDPDPKVARATFVNEATGGVLATTPLTRNGSSGGLAIWDNAGAPVSVPITADHVGVRIALGGGTSTTCGALLVDCYDALSTNGIVHIQGWSGAGTVTQRPPDGPQEPPLVRSVGLTQGSCSPSFSDAASSCTIGIEAKIDFGGDPTNVGAKLTATVGGVAYPMTYTPGTATWSVGGVTVAPASGPIDVALDWEETRGKIGRDTCKVGGGNKCTGSFGTVQRQFSATADRSGPIALTEISEGGVNFVNSLQRCSAVLLGCSHNLVVKIGIKGGLALSDLDDPPVRLRVIGGSQNQSLDCDPSVSKLKDELAQGCQPAYTPYTGSAPCPDSPSALWSIANPPKAWECVATQTGNATNQVAAGLNQRILGSESPSSCPLERRNHWPDYEPGDRRIVFVIVTPFGAFSGSGNTTVPVVRFAAFYITGWTGQGGGFANPCLGQGDEVPTNPAEIVGRFIQYVDVPNDGGAGDEACDLSAIDPCTAVLVN
jgi:hypothetical protein